MKVGSSSHPQRRKISRERKKAVKGSTRMNAANFAIHSTPGSGTEYVRVTSDIAPITSAPMILS